MSNDLKPISKAHCVLYHLDDFRQDPEYIRRVQDLRPDYQPHAHKPPLNAVDNFLKTMGYAVACGAAVGLVGALMVLLSVGLRG